MDEQIFEEWIESYPEPMRREFHRDGVIDKDTYSQEKTKILFVLKEPNAKDGNYDRFCGKDLTKVWGTLKKSLDYNIARWAQILLDHKDGRKSLSWDEVAQTIQRVAIINLKKIAGTSSANTEEICIYSFNDRIFLRKQIEAINPDVILACGKDGLVFRMIWRIMKDDMYFPKIDDSKYLVCLGKRSIPVFLSYHPSVRPNKWEEAAKAVGKLQSVLKT